MIAALAAALLAVQSPPAPVVTPAPANISLIEAAHAIEAGRLDQAKDMLAAAVASGASGEAVDRLLADLAFARGENQRAFDLYRALSERTQNDPLLLERGGIAALRLGHDRDAIALLDRATALPGVGWRAWNARGVAADRHGAWAEADAAYARAARLAPGEGEIANNRGWSLLLRGRWEEALPLLETAARLEPRSVRATNNLELARAALAADLPERHAGEGDASWAARLNDAGVAAALRGDRARAIAAFSRAIEKRSEWYEKAAKNLAAVGGKQ